MSSGEEGKAVSEDPRNIASNTNGYQMYPNQQYYQQPTMPYANPKYFPYDRYQRAPYGDPYYDYSMRMEYNKGNEQDETQMNHVNIENESDSRSLYVGNLDYSASSEQLQYHFAQCGVITRVTILHDKFTRQPKGYAYVEFETEEAANNGLGLHDSPFLGRPIKVLRKRSNHMTTVLQNRARGGGGGGGRGGGRRGGGNFGGPPRGMRPNFYHPYF